MVRASIRDDTNRGRLRNGIAALQSRLRQRVETVTHTASFERETRGVEELDPPDDIDEFWDQYQTTGIVRANINQFVSDVVEPGVRVQADDDTTVEYFMGGDDAPTQAPEGGFLRQSFVHAGERHQPFEAGLKTTIASRWVRGTAIVELLKQDREDPDSPITGFYHIPPETIHPQVERNRNILLPPDPDDIPPDVDRERVDRTPRDEVAAYLQFADQSILGRRLGGFNRDAIPLSQNDVHKQVLDPDIGGAKEDEQGVFGTSILESITTDIEEYKAIKRDRHTAIQRKAYGIWLANFSREVIDAGDHVEIVEWDTDSQNSFEDTLDDLGPGDVLHADGPVDLKAFDGDVPNLDSTLQHYVDDITAPLPAPKYSVGFEKNINQFVTERQEERYLDVITEERRYQERKWTNTFREIARRHPDLDPEGLRVTIEPDADASPIRSLNTEDIEKIKTYADALDVLAGPASDAGALVDDAKLRELILQLPEDSAPGVEQPVDESDADVEAQWQELVADD